MKKKEREKNAKKHRRTAKRTCGCGEK